MKKNTRNILTGLIVLSFQLLNANETPVLSAYDFEAVPLTDSVKNTIPVYSEELKLYVPNAFTPNGDRTNDYFEVVHSGAFDFEIFIYNSHGTLVFQSNDLNFIWDGKFNGRNLASGTYVYLIQGEFNQTGTLNLIR